MTPLPAALTRYLTGHTLKGRNPAYLCVGAHGRLADYGGDIHLYGIGPLSKGTPILEQVWFLTGMLPLTQVDLVLPCVQIQAGLYADVHIIRQRRHHWVLFLRVMEEELAHLQLFEKANDNNLLHERHTKILDQYLGRAVFKALDEGMISISESGERRHVSILFVDIRGFTSFSEAHAPEVVFATLNHYLSAMIQPLLDESAVVDKIIGDAVMAVFGILTTAVSPPHQAVVSALKIIDAVRDLNRERSRTGRPLLAVGIGISTGPVAVGVLGSSIRKSFSVVGHHVNLASRLQSSAEPFEILIDENTYREIVAYQQGFKATSLPLKGLAGPVRVYSHRMHTTV